MPTSEVPSLVELVTAVEAESFAADLSDATLQSGAQNFVLETPGWIFRFPRKFIDFDLELAVLATLDGRLPIQTPKVEWVGRHSRFCAYRKIIGIPFDADAYRSASRARQQALAASLAEYLVALHGSVTDEEAASLGIPDFFTLAQRADLIAPERIPETVRPEVSGMLDRSREISGQVEGRALLDNDFTSDNFVLSDEMGVLSGVWDYSGVTMGPPSFDFRALLRNPDPLTEDVVHAYERSTGLEICREAYTLALRITDVLIALRSERPYALERLVATWR